MNYKDISEKWLHENEDLHNLSEQIAPIQFGLERMERSLATQFKLISFMTQTHLHVQKLNKHPEQFKLNRYPEYMTFQPTRVLLGKPQQKQDIENYINANFIDILGKRAIATQAPLSKTTFYNFWRMIDQYKVNKIFMLSNIIEKTKLKCDRYYPLNTQPESKMVEKQYEIELIQDFNLNKRKTIKIRKLRLTNTNTNLSRIITHYQMIDWTDGEVPRNNNKKWMDYLINQFLEDIKDKNIPVVHCSAGVGRTGTFMMTAIVRLLVSNNHNISVFNEVRKMREQRWGMVHTSTQYQYIYQFTEREINKHYNGMGSLISQSSSSDDEDEQKN